MTLTHGSSRRCPCTRASIRDLAAELREAHAGRRLIRRCAWCERFEIGGRWLHLDAIGSGQQRITSTLLDRAAHGIWPVCFARQTGD